MFYDTENMLSLKGTDTQISCAHLERQPDFSLSGVILVRITHRHRNIQVILPEFGWSCFFFHELYKHSFNKIPIAIGGKKGLDLGWGEKGCV